MCCDVVLQFVAPTASEPVLTSTTASSVSVPLVRSVCIYFIQHIHTVKKFAITYLLCG